MNEILVLVPTRGRPASAAYFMEAWDAHTSTFADLMFVVDDDDPELGGYRAVVPQHKLTVGPRLRLGPTLNREAVRWADVYEVVGFMGDDHRVRTQSWDATILHELRRSDINVTYGNDLFQGERLPTAVFMRGHLVSALGYMCPPQQVHLYLDDFWLVLGRAVGMSYLPDVIVEHMHPVAGKSAWDPQYQEVNSGEMYEHDRNAFQAYMQHSWYGELDKLRSLGFGVHIAD